MLNFKDADSDAVGFDIRTLTGGEIILFNVDSNFGNSAASLTREQALEVRNLLDSQIALTTRFSEGDIIRFYSKYTGNYELRYVHSGLAYDFDGNVHQKIRDDNYAGAVKVGTKS